MSEEKYKCSNCFSDCEIEQEEIHYSATHCAPHGGIHKTGFYWSACCYADFTTYDELDNNNTGKN